VTNTVMKWAMRLLCLVGSMAAITALQVPRLNQLQTLEQDLTESELIRQDNETRLQLQLLNQLPSFGFDNLVANWAFLSFAQYFGDNQARELTGYQLSPEFFEVILDKDPYFWHAYLFLSSSTTLYAGQPERSVSMMNETLPLLSPTVPDRSYYIWRWKAVDELLFLGDSAAAQRSLETAARWASVHPDTESQLVAELSRQTAAALANNPDSLEAQVSAWSSVFYNAFDDDVRQLAVRRIQELGADASITPDGGLEVILPSQE